MENSATWWGSLACSKKRQWLRGLHAKPLSPQNGAPVRTRTGNQLIKSQLLYQLSYRGKSVGNLDDRLRLVWSQ